MDRTDEKNGELLQTKLWVNNQITRSFTVEIDITGKNQGLVKCEQLNSEKSYQWVYIETYSESLLKKWTSYRKVVYKSTNCQFQVQVLEIEVPILSAQEGIQEQLDIISVLCWGKHYNSPIVSFRKESKAIWKLQY